MNLDFHVSYQKTTQVLEPPPRPHSPGGWENKLRKKWLKAKITRPPTHRCAHTEDKASKNEEEKKQTPDLKCTTRARRGGMLSYKRGDITTDQHKRASRALELEDVPNAIGLLAEVALHVHCLIAVGRVKILLITPRNPFAFQK